MANKTRLGKGEPGRETARTHEVFRSMISRLKNHDPVVKKTAFLSMKEDQLKEIVSELLTRPGHEKVRGNLLRLLTDGLGASSTDITFEQQLNRFRVRGRIDALLGRTVFEVKSDLRREKKDADRQLRLYIMDREAETKQPWIGVATDGAEYYVAMLRDDKLVELGSFKPKADEPRAILGWLESVVVLNVELPPDVESIRRELGRESIHYRRAMNEIEALWKQLETNPEAVLKRDLWNRLLRVAYGADIGAPLLFLQHTYLTVVAKSIATAALTDNLPPNSEALLSGQAFRDLGIVGAIESDFFDWILLEANGRDLVMEIARHANRFRLKDIDTDVLRGLYENLIDPAQRHDLGEYYTPDWLAERVCEETITVPLEQRVIDAACGSGTFLFHAVRRLLLAAHQAKKSPADAVALACERIAGVDVHPVVIFARATYLLALMPTLKQGRPSSLGVPVYLGDSLQWNAREFMSQSDLEIIVPAAGESGGSLPAEDDERRTILRFPATVAKEPGLFDAVLEEMLNLAERGQPSRAVEAWLHRHGVTANSEIQMLKEGYQAFRRLQKEGRNHIWGYVARTRPIWLASEKQKADVVIGNPPWLAYRAMNKVTQKRFMEEMKACGIWGGLSSVSAYDLSAYFFARAVQLYMRAKGKIAFVMPYAAMTRKPFALFRKGSFKVGGYKEGQVRFTAAWVFRADVRPLFEVPSCVLWAESTRSIQPLPRGVRYFSGTLPCRDAHRAQAAQALQETLGSWPADDDSAASSVYRDTFRQGAILIPRRFVLVERVPTGRLGANPHAPVVKGRKGTQDKEPWKSIVPPQGAVESNFIRPVFLGQSIAPFRPLVSIEGIIPIDEDSHEIISSSGAAARGYSALAKWIGQVEELWKRHGKGSRSFQQQLDFFEQLSRQFPIASLRVVYSKAGTNPAAAILYDRRAIIDHMLYWANTPSIDEARYLTAVLNSETTRARAEKWQAMGQWGARHFDKVLFNLPIPRFDEMKPLHLELTFAAKDAERIAAAVPLKAGEHFTRARKRIRDGLLEAGVAQRMDEMVAELLGAPVP
jgi:hypothetical protein